MVLEGFGGRDNRDGRGTFLMTGGLKMAPN